MKFSVDRTHFKNHVEKWCRANMNPVDNRRKSLFDELLNMDSQIEEEENCPSTFDASQITFSLVPFRSWIIEY